MIRWLFAAIAVILAGHSLPAYADDLRPAVVELVQRDGTAWQMEWKLPVATQSALRDAEAITPVIPSICRTSGDPARRVAVLSVFGSIALTCEGDWAEQSFGLSGLGANSDALARFLPLDATSQTFRLTPDEPEATIAGEPSRYRVFADYFVIGAEHILFGWDHLLFVIALVFLVRRPWDVVKAATAFTIAHSITLVATTLGYAGLPSRPVEALIALSIVFLAVEVALILKEPERETWTRRYPWAVAFAFGLFHGFGFAGALSDIGLPQGEVAAALLAFNLGVEAGQLAVVAATIGALALMVRFAPKGEAPALRFATYGIGIIGSYWLIERVAGF
ncbi:MAG: HupE/UreJ family protein [Pseudomonadota bacterium]|nr:HupE/UreJ family protein [Pseudomonadota bacterium]